jgi:hypothetical protein
MSPRQVDTDGGASEAICTVTICNDDERTTRFAKALKILRMDLDSLHIAEDDWARQISEVRKHTPCRGSLASPPPRPAAWWSPARAVFPHAIGAFRSSWRPPL